jgi:hypothetical protein
MSKNITISDETWEKIKDQVNQEEKNIKEKSEKKFEIKSRWTGEIIYTSTKTTYKEAVEEAVSKGAYLRDAYLGGAYVGGADLEGADLEGADLRGANLGGANLGDADLRDADLGGAYLGDADFYHTKFYGKGGNTKIRKSQLDDFMKALGVVIED